ATAVPYPMPASAEGRVDHQIEELQTQVPASMRALAEMNVAQTRALYQRSANAFEAVFESWEDCLDAAGQGAVAFNRKIMDIAERNISTGFDLATRLARAKNPVEAIELQAAYWRKQFGELRMQAEEVRTLLERVTDSVAEPIKAQVTQDRMPR
ncbi:MAG: phasin family protein, partial [Methyloceanibacter sp.]